MQVAVAADEAAVVYNEVAGFNSVVAAKTHRSWPPEQRILHQQPRGHRLDLGQQTVPPDPAALECLYEAWRKPVYTCMTIKCASESAATQHPAAVREEPCAMQCISDGLQCSCLQC